jgi:hypothetical protein
MNDINKAAFPIGGISETIVQLFTSKKGVGSMCLTPFDLESYVLRN